MRTLVVNHLSLDGVFQGPGDADEDTREDFEQGGWASVASDQSLGEVMAQHMGENFEWLFGRRTYDDVLGHWNEVRGPFKEGLDDRTKYVVSTHTDAELPWPNSVLVTGDVPDQVAALRERPGGKLVIMGSGELVRTLLPNDLIDEMLLFIHPVLLGSGHRLFEPREVVTWWNLTDATSTSSGVLVAAYEPAR